MKRVVLVFLIVTAGCGASSETPADAGAVVRSNDASADVASSDAGVPRDPRDAYSGDVRATDASSVVDGSAHACDSGACASVVGFVLRTATKPKHGGKGPIYVALFDGNPILDASHAVVVARTLLPSTDFSADDAKVPYRVDGVPVRAAAYQAIAFLDDANAVTPNNPQPGSGDLISLSLSGTIGGIPLVVAAEGEASLDLPLNAALP